MASMKLYTFAGEFRAYKALIAAQYNGVKLECPKFEQGKDNLTKDFLAKSPLGKVPVLETPHGCLFESNAIARYVAKVRRDTELAGRTFFESAQVDSWMDFASSDVELPATMLVYPILGFVDFKQNVNDKAAEELHRALAVLERHLLPRTFVVGESVTLADIALASALYYPFKLVLDADARAPYPSVARWFLTCVNQPQFRAVLGEVELCVTPMGAGAAAPKAGKAAAAGAAAAAPKAEKKKEAKPAAAPAAAAAPKADKKKKDDDDDGADEDDIPKEPKKADPFAVLPPTKFVLDEWKRTYSNSRPDYYSSMKWFWDNLDLEGYTLYSSKYKYNAENKVDWQTSNLIGGFIQRCDEVRKYAFGSMVVLGSAAPYEVEGCWIIRGNQEVGLKAMLEANPDAEYYEWTKLDTADEAVRKHIADFWCAESAIGARTVYDSKIFK